MTPWSKELWRLFGLISLALILGLIFGHYTALLLLTLGGYLFWHLRNIYRLQRWLSRPGKRNAPQGTGIWMEVFDRIYHLQKQNRSRKQRLASYLNRFKESTAAMPDATVILNEHTQIEWINKAAQKLLGLRPAQDIGQHIGNLIRHPKFIHYLNTRRFDVPLEITTPIDDQRYISVRLIPYGQDQRLLIARDITRLKRLEEMRRDFVANISHELRTPLTVLRGYIETMQEEANNIPDKWRDSIAKMVQQSIRMENIVNDLLMLSQLETEKPDSKQTRIDMVALLTLIREDALALGQDKNHTITLDIDESVGLKGNHKELHSAISNLVYNAVHYTPANGEITLHWFRDASGGHLEVKDTGIGIAPQHLPRLSERFYRVDIGRSRDSGGTGLGLAIVKHILLQHEARLRIFSQVGQGSTFSCDFPEDRLFLSKEASSSTPKIANS